MYTSSYFEFEQEYDMKLDEMKWERIYHNFFNSKSRQKNVNYYQNVVI